MSHEVATTPDRVPIELIAWLFSPATDRMTVSEVRRVIREQWGEDADRALESKYREDRP